MVCWIGWQTGWRARLREVMPVGLLERLLPQRTFQWIRGSHPPRRTARQQVAYELSTRLRTAWLRDWNFSRKLATTTC